MTYVAYVSMSKVKAKSAIKAINTRGRKPRAGIGTPYLLCCPQQSRGTMPRSLRSSGKAGVPTRPSAPAARKKKKATKSSTKSKSKPDAAASLLTLPSDAVASAFLYLDVEGVPKAAVVCREWNAILKSVEEELWLSLVRRHHPVAERIARMLPPPSSASAATAAAKATDGGCGQPPPAKRGRLAIDWKDQFRRARAMSKLSSVPSPEPTTASRPEPKPLSSYFFQVDLILYKGVKGKRKSEWEKPGVVSTIVDGNQLRFAQNNAIQLSIRPEDIAEELDKYSFTSFDIKLILFDKSTGKRAFFYQGSLDDHCDPNTFIFEPSDLMTELYEPKISSVTGDIPGNPWVGCMLFASKNGCICDCHNGKDWNLFSPPPSCPCCYCKCCSCKRNGRGSKWSCFWGMDIELSLAVFWEWDIDDIEGKRGQLEILEKVKFV